MPQSNAHMRSRTLKELEIVKRNFRVADWSFVRKQWRMSSYCSNNAHQLLLAARAWETIFNIKCSNLVFFVCIFCLCRPQAACFSTQITKLLRLCHSRKNASEQNARLFRKWVRIADGLISRMRSWNDGAWLDLLIRRWDVPYQMVWWNRSRPSFERV